MIIIPAIDLIKGEVVRLIQGDFNKCEIYSKSPEIVARDFEKKGAKFLHIIDLEGALEGKLINLKSIGKIIDNIEIPTQVGGGVRNVEDIDILLRMGVERVIIGTKVLEEDFLRKVISLFGDRIIVSLDAKGGKIAIKGWKDITSISILDFVKIIEKIGVKRLIYTDIKRDGTLTGCNIEGIKNILNNVSISVIASGGISSLQDVRKLKKLNLEGVIIGKALYEGRLFLEEVIQEVEK